MTDDELVEAVRARVKAGRPTDFASTLAAPELASLDEVADAERAIGFRLPPLVRRLYLEIADGGIGPFLGFSPLHDEELGMVNFYLSCLNAEPSPEDPPALPPGVLFLCDFGCAMWALLDCRHPAGQMWWWEEGDRHKLDLTFPQWIQAWIEGDLTHDYMEARRLLDESWVGPWADEQP
ncbi:SMI1/KNR4 family protein [Streptomyces sp. NBC_00264]|uniref:SMI1/KNR4 family protein n=1 Tax=unclassified Streptomyces TaxID=2593676 RepID=UPI002250BCA3|nr:MULTISPECIES: SMI1/KNR4 family protein [unclassified Streptomyces]MCX5158683.1 SMI1/KNR4 family protein [Streptomyces sp. NBC_00305]MCX5217206.1 SMI1/KNR4 family protein [Streptomyces sp. NBC_00264]